MFRSRSNNISYRKITRVDRITGLKLGDLLTHMMENYTSNEIEEALNINNIKTYCEIISNGKSKHSIGKAVQ